jgi:hypothetical protein
MVLNSPQRFLGASATVWSAIWLLFLSVASAPAAFYRMFTGFAAWDDEGMMLMTVKQYLDGAKLYQEITSGYGPVYYFFNGFVHSIVGAPVNHEGVRLTSVAVWMLSALVFAWIVFRLTGSLAIASVVHVLTFRGLAFFQNEPGHPQELCIILLSGLLVGGLLAARPRYQWIAMILVGMMPAGLLCIKVNIGIFTIIAATLAIIYHLPLNRFVRLARITVGLAALVLPFALMKVHFDDSSARVYCCVVTAAVAALLVCLRSPEPGSLSWKNGWIALASFAITLTTVFAALWAQGIPVRSTVSALVISHINLNVSQRFWYLAAELGWPWIFWALGSLIASWAVTRKLIHGSKQVDNVLNNLKLLVGGGTLLLAVARPEFLLGFVTPFCWLLLCPPSKNVDCPLAFPRLLLAATAALQTLYAYPIAGSQLGFLRISLVVVGATLFGDFVRVALASRLQPAIRPWFRAASSFVLICAALSYSLVDYRAKRAYESLPPLGLRGAERLHLDSTRTSEYHWLVNNLNRYCDTFVGIPGLPSLYLWTGKPMPGPMHESPGQLSTDNWLYGWSPQQQQVIVTDLARYPNACAVHNPELVKFWNKGNMDLSMLPLVNYIQTNFQTVDHMGPLEFMVRRGRHLDLHAVLGSRHTEPSRQGAHERQVFSN